MGMSCSLTGHLWEDDTHVETERKICESGEIIIQKELQRCSRCDTTNIIKENKTAKDTSQNMTEENKHIAADGGREPDNGDEGVVIMSDDEPSDTNSDTVEQTNEQKETTGFDPDSHNANTNVGDVGPEGNEVRTGTENTPSIQSHGTEVIPDSEQHNVQIMGESESIQEQSDKTNSLSSKDVSPEQDAVICPDCSFKAPVEEVTVFAGDACPECCHAYLNIR